jgi:transposase
MDKVTGIDVSKATFDVAFYEDEKWKHHKFCNEKKGFESFLKILGSESICVMEASGPYYVQLAMFLEAHDIKVSVVNPLVIKRFSQMRMIRAKTDKKDARVIAEYGVTEKPGLWKSNDKSLFQMQQIMTALEGIGKQKTMIKNQLEAFENTGVIDAQVKKSLKSILRSLQGQEEKLGFKLNEYTKKQYADTFELLTSIPAIGPKTATMLIVLTSNFTKFDNYKALIAYVGFSPRIFQSGTSVKGKGHICKMGNSQIRKLLYLCSWSAKKANKACIEMYDRLKEKGKPERVIKIALANKLLKQAFAIVKSATAYDENYRSCKINYVKL